MTHLDVLLGELRKRQGSRSVRSFAEEMGLNREKMRLLMNGDRAPSIDFLKEIAAAFADDEAMVRTILDYSKSAVTGSIFFDLLNPFKRKK